MDPFPPKGSRLNIPRSIDEFVSEPGKILVLLSFRREIFTHNIDYYVSHNIFFH